MKKITIIFLLGFFTLTVYAENPKDVQMLIDRFEHCEHAFIKKNKSCTNLKVDAKSLMSKYQNDYLVSKKIKEIYHYLEKNN